jgi:hypothetical protein
MFDPQMELLCTVLSAVVADAPGESGRKTWAEARAACTACGVSEPDLAIALEREDEAALRRILEEWRSDRRHLPEHDRDVLKRALKAYRKRLKVTLLDAESSVGGGPFSSGRKSSIVGITPPERYPRAVWQELVRQRRLVDSGQGTYELPPE